MCWNAMNTQGQRWLNVNIPKEGWVGNEARGKHAVVSSFLGRLIATTIF